MVDRELVKRVVDGLADRMNGDNRTLDRALFDEVRADENHPLRSEYIFDPEQAIEELGLQTSRKLIKLARLAHYEPMTRRDMQCAAYVRNPMGPAGDFVQLPRIRDQRDLSVELARNEFKRAENAIKRADAATVSIPNIDPVIIVERDRLIALIMRLWGARSLPEAAE